MDVPSKVDVREIDDFVQPLDGCRNGKVDAVQREQRTKKALLHIHDPIGKGDEVVPSNYHIHVSEQSPESEGPIEHRVDQAIRIVCDPLSPLLSQFGADDRNGVLD